jgi:cytochrome c
MLRLTVVLLLASVAAANAQPADPARGQRVFAACAACHSLQPGKQMTGPSLAGVWNRKAGSLADFPRYSDALKSADVTWDDQTLDAWITSPDHVIPGNDMTFPGVKDPQQRLDLLAYLKQATRPGATIAQVPGGGGMQGMMAGGSAPNLKTLDAEDRVQSVTYCRETYIVATANGQKRKFWERNLRLKTDSGADGPAPGSPALVAAGMMGDRADLIFASPDEIGKFIARTC